ncbi:hypothetical protein M9H77_06882 [Catharanthus roseus]|uniref:Uncharacterized protein n=1 Tax=Catharanthus roseus TaxID=4058 RepID=A0ACC0BTM2_CATRO|nr:hypothetical protein M9H77_06882 [Catharanthus roseus]
MPASRPSTRWSRFSMYASTTPMPSSTRVRCDLKPAMRSLDFPLSFGITRSHCSSRPQPCCNDSTLVMCGLSTPTNSKKALIHSNSQRLDENLLLGNVLPNPNRLLHRLHGFTQVYPYRITSAFLMRLSR